MGELVALLIAAGYPWRMSRSDETVTLELSSAEALVLFEFLSRFVDNDSLIIADQAEARVLWDTQCLLERQLVAPFADYESQLAKARDLVRDPAE